MPYLHPVSAQATPRISRQMRIAERRIESRWRLILVLGFALAAIVGRADAALPPFGENALRQWTFDRLGDLGDEAAMTIGPRSHPLAVYYDCGTSPKTLIFARFDGQVWEREAVTSFDSPCGGLFPGLAIQVDGDDRVQIAYFEARGPGDFDDRLRYAERTTSGAWEFTDIYSGGGRAVSLALRQGMPVVAFKSGTDLSLMYAERQGDGTWSVESTGSELAVSVALGIAMTIDDAGIPRIAYGGAPPHFSLMYATRVGGVWTHTSLASGNVGGAVYQARGIGGQQVIAFVRYLANGSSEIAALHRLAASDPFDLYRLASAGPGGVASVHGIGMAPDDIVAPILVRNAGESQFRVRLATLDPDNGNPVESVIDAEFNPFGTPELRAEHGLAIAFAANGAGSHLIYALPEYGDMRWMRTDLDWSAPKSAYQADTDAEDGLTMAYDPNGRSELLFGANCDLVQSTHRPGGYFSERIAVPGPAGCGATQISFRIAPDGRRIALLRTQAGGIVEARRAAAESAPWQFNALGAGQDPHHFIASDGSRIRLWVNRTAIEPGTLVLQSIAPDGTLRVQVLLDAFEMHPESRISAELNEFTVAGSTTPLLRISMAWSDPSDGSLHLATLETADEDRAVFTVEDRIVDQLAGVRAGEALALTTDRLGAAVIAYSRCQGATCAIELTGGIGSANGNLTLGTTWNGAVSDLAIALVDGSAREVRVLAVQDGGPIDFIRYFRCSSVGGCEAENFGDVTHVDPNRYQDRVAIGATGPLRLLWSDTRISFQRAQLHQQSDERGGSTSSTLAGGVSAPTFLCPYSLIPSPVPRKIGIEPKASGGDLNARLRERFSQTAAGRYYVDLYATHAQEIVSLTLADPAQLLDQARTFQNFVPALTAFVDGQGDTVIFTPQLVNQARLILENWRDNGSPALRDAVIYELDRLVDLEVFAGGSFDEWFEDLTVGATGDGIFADDFEG